MFWRFSPAARSPRFAFRLATDHCSFAPRPTPHQRGQAVSRPSPAGYCHPPTTELTKTERDPISTSGPSLFSMSQSRAICSDKSIRFSPLAAAQPLNIPSWPEALNAKRAEEATHFLAPRKRGWLLSPHGRCPSRDESVSKSTCPVTLAIRLVKIA